MILSFIFLTFAQVHAGAAHDHVPATDVSAQSKKRYCNGNYDAEMVAQDLPYEKNSTGDKQQNLDLYIPKGAPRPYKTIVLIHGGCFQGGDKANGDTKEQIMRFVKAGYAVASINYRLAKPDPGDPSKSINKYPTSLDDVRDAWCYLQNNGAEKFSLNSEQMVAMGYSAGSTLATYLGTGHTAGSAHKTDCKPKVAGVIGMFGRSIFTKSTETHKNENGLDCGEDFVGERRNDANPQQGFRDADVISHIDRKSAPPFHLVHGTSDHYVNLQNSQALCDAMKGTCELQKIEGADHMFEKGDEMNEAFEGNCKFLAETVFTGERPVQTAVEHGSSR